MSLAPPAGGASPVPFGERLAGRVAERRSNLVLGLDPDPARLWPAALREAGAGVGGSVAQRAGAAVAAHCRLLVDAAGPECVAVKLQLACFERLGAPGWAALERTAAHARHAGLLVIADAKRGDVPVSAAAYAQGLLGATPTPFGEVLGLGADAVTVSPLLGEEALAPFVTAARAAGAGVFVLVRTSNPGAADVQDAPLFDGRPVWEWLAEMVDRLGRAQGDGLADVGAVIGATEPQHLHRARELMPRAVLLLPGVGAQGGRVEDLAPAFVPGPAGGLVTASRSIDRAYEAACSEPAAAALAQARALREVGWSTAAA
ncbi:MAG: orotidine-5'-phosphate decarboxylase [Solirubrobacteraceae bacterium]